MHSCRCGQTQPSPASSAAQRATQPRKRPTSLLPPARLAAQHGPAVGLAGVRRHLLHGDAPPRPPPRAQPRQVRVPLRQARPVDRAEANLKGHLLARAGARRRRRQRRGGSRGLVGAAAGRRAVHHGCGGQQGVLRCRQGALGVRQCERGVASGAPSCRIVPGGSPEAAALPWALAAQETRSRRPPFWTSPRLAAQRPLPRLCWADGRQGRAGDARQMRAARQEGAGQDSGTPHAAPPCPTDCAARLRPALSTLHSSASLSPCAQPAEEGTERWAAGEYKRCRG